MCAKIRNLKKTLHDVPAEANTAARKLIFRIFPADVYKNMKNVNLYRQLNLESNTETHNTQLYNILQSHTNTYACLDNVNVFRGVFKNTITLSEQS